MNEAHSVRIDKWLWAARFFKTRSLATAAVANGEVRVAGECVKPARPVKVGDAVEIRRGGDSVCLVVRALAEMRGPAPVAQRLYEETDESRERRARRLNERAAAAEPAWDLRGRPTKRDARVLRRLRSSS